MLISGYLYLRPLNLLAKQNRICKIKLLILFQLSEFVLLSVLKIMHESIPAVPMPPRANPRALAFFFKWANSPGWGHISCLNAPGWGRRKRANAPPLVSSPPNTSADFY